MIPLTFLYDENIDRSKLSEQKTHLRIEFLPIQVGSKQLQMRSMTVHFTVNLEEQFCKNSMLILRDSYKTDDNLVRSCRKIFKLLHSFANYFKIITIYHARFQGKTKIHSDTVELSPRAEKKTCTGHAKVRNPRT